MTRFTPIPIPARERIIDSMVELARCSRLHRIIVAGSTAPELVFALHRRGFVRVATTATCGLPHGQYGVALVDWQGRSIKALESTLDWLVQFLASSAVLVIWLDSPERTANRKLQTMLEGLGFGVEVGARCEHGLAIRRAAAMQRTLPLQLERRSLQRRLVKARSVAVPRAPAFARVRHQARFLKR